MANYATADDAASIAGYANAAAFPGGGAATFQAWWLDEIDGFIERHLSQGFKAATKTTTLIGTGNTLLRLPSVAASIASITEDAVALPTTDYNLETGGKLVEREAMNIPQLYYYNNGLAGWWYKGSKYIVTYVEPDLSALPPKVRLTAAMMGAQVWMFARKHKDFGIALTASDAGSAGHVATSDVTTFPASLMEELNRTLLNGLKRGTI